jgi:hypothetical protein
MHGRQPDGFTRIVEITPAMRVLIADALSVGAHVKKL